jgi:hypothetical protein
MQSVAAGRSFPEWRAELVMVEAWTSRAEKCKKLHRIASLPAVDWRCWVAAPGERISMKLTLLGTDSKSGQSPTLYATDRGTVVVQGWRVTDSDALDALDLPEHETAVEVPLRLLRFAPPADQD